MTASSHPGMKFTWCLLPTGLKIENSDGPADREHKFVRKANGLWIVSNAHVTIEQRAPPPRRLASGPLAFLATSLFVTFS